MVVAEIVALATALTLRKNNKITLRKRVQRVLDLDSFLNIKKILLKNLLISTINYKYLYQILKNNESNIMELRVGSGLPNIQKKSINEYRINVSMTLEEQQKIADFLFSIDDKIEKLSSKLEELKEFKKGLLQQMFV